MIAVVLASGAAGFVPIERASNRPTNTTETAPVLNSSGASHSAVENDSLHDGFPDAARIVRPEDRATFIRWLTFLAEAQYYAPSPGASDEIHDCAGLIRFAFRNALMAHTSAWLRSVLSAHPGVAAQIENEASFGELQEFIYPEWVLGPNLFRTRAGPLAPGDLADGSFAQFADAATLLHFNTFFVSRDVRAARPGDLFFYYQPGQHEAYHSMLFVGRSYFQPQAADWVVYHTGDINGQAGQVREMEVQMLMKIPDPRWRPLASNPRFLGVYRFELLR
ncbi:MAG TPA: DUF1175 family protein [Terriglobia bacterium]|nr:DUF1175 family protein [Terriglobia bacterium]